MFGKILIQSANIFVLICIEVQLELGGVSQ